MAFFRKASLLFLALPATLSFAAKIPTNLNDNVITCNPSAGCTNKTMFGRSYKAIQTDRFDVMVSFSNEGSYSRADVSITNHLGYPQSISPEDFRVEVTAPKPHILLYIPPTSLQNVPPSPAITTTPTPTPAPAASATGTPTTPSPDIDELFAQAKKEAAAKEASERAAAEQHLPATPIQPNDTIRGRVYFERDNKAKSVNVVIPIAGVVFEFPYTLRK